MSRSNVNLFDIVYVLVSRTKGARLTDCMFQCQGARLTYLYVSVSRNDVNRLYVSVSRSEVNRFVCFGVKERG